jgi:integrase
MKEQKKTRGIFEKVPSSGIWWIRFMDSEGKYRREKCGSWTTASKKLTLRRAEALQGVKLPKNLRRRRVTFAEIAADALDYSRAHKRSYQDDESRMKRLKEWFGSRAADSLTVSEIGRQLSAASNEEEWAPSTFNHYRSLLMMTYREAIRAEKVTSNPARHVRHEDEDNSRVRYLDQFEPLPTKIEFLKHRKTEDERLRAVIEHDYPEHMPEFVLAVNTGLRKGSQYALSWDMVDWKGRMLNIPKTWTKQKKPHHAPLNDAALAALKIVRGSDDTPGRVFQSAKTGAALQNSRHWFDDAVVKAGITDFHWHDLRHTFASRLRMKGKSIPDICELMGHSSLTMTMRYAHLGPGKLHEVVSALDSNSPTVAPDAIQPETISSSYLQ